jgi:transcriptional regulator with XRE-family HTH domain
MSFGETVRRLRKERHWTQQELGARASLPSGTISHIENGRNDNPTQDTLDRLARALEVQVSELVDAKPDILDGPFPAANLRDLGLTDAFLARYARLWVDLPRDQRAWLIGHLRIVADAERRIRALEAAAADDEPDRVVPADAQGPAVLAHIVS